jgi:hypothetical protein
MSSDLLSLLHCKALLENCLDDLLHDPRDQLCSERMDLIHWVSQRLAEAVSDLTLLGPITCREQRWPELAGQRSFGSS